MADYEAVVIGGGIVGASTAYHLARAGSETLLVDREDEGRATDAGAGILSPGTSSRALSEPWFRFAVDAVGYYPDLVERLRTEQDGDVGYARPGLLQVAADPAEEKAFDRAGERIAERQRRYGEPAPGSVEELAPAAAAERFPPLGEVVAARLYRDAARVDGRTFARALRRAARSHGLDVRRGDAERVETADGAVAGVVVDGARVRTANVVVAGGAWSAAFGDQLGVALPVEPQRGQIVHLDTGRDAAGWPIVAAFREHYLVPWPGGRVAAGATREDESGFAPHATAAGVREVLVEALRVAPGLGDAAIGEVRVGLRPVSPDGLPALGAAPGVEGAYLATGHGATGLQLGPYSGRVVADLVRGADPDADLDPFAPDRF